MAIKKTNRALSVECSVVLFYKVCKTAITLPLALLALVLRVLQVLQVLRVLRVQVLALVQVPLLWRALPVSSLQPYRNQSLQMTVLPTTASKEQKQIFSSLTTLPPFKDFQMLGYHTHLFSVETYSIFPPCQGKSNDIETKCGIYSFRSKMYDFINF
jgi:hypothetical protein